MFIKINHNHNWLVVSSHLKNMLVKLEIFPKFRGQKSKKYLKLPPSYIGDKLISCHLEEGKPDNWYIKPSWYPKGYHRTMPPTIPTCDGRGVGDADRTEPGDRGDAFSERRGEGTAVTCGSWSVPKRGNLWRMALGVPFEGVVGP